MKNQVNPWKPFSKTTQYLSPTGALRTKWSYPKGAWPAHSSGTPEAQMHFYTLPASACQASSAAVAIPVDVNQISGSKIGKPVPQRILSYRLLTRREKNPQELWEKQPLYRLKQKMKHYMILKIHTFIIHPWKAPQDRGITGALRTIRTLQPTSNDSSPTADPGAVGLSSVGSEPHRSYDQGPPCQKTASDSAQCASYEGCPHLKFGIIKAHKSWGTSKTARNTGVKLPAYNKLGFSAVTVLVHPHSPKPMSQPHFIGPLYWQTFQNWRYMRFLAHKISIVSPGWQHFPGKGRKEVHKEGK